MVIGLKLFIVASVASQIFATNTPTQRPTTPSPTKNPTTAKPTPNPTPELDPSFLLEADSKFLNFFVDPFDPDFAQSGPSPVIARGGKNVRVEKEWEGNKVRIPRHLDFFAFNLWHGDSDNLVPFFDAGAVVSVKSRNRDVLPMVKLVTEQSFTTQIEAEFECAKDGDVEVEFLVNRVRLHKFTFTVVKQCSVSHSQELLVSTSGGELVFHDGKITTPFNVHDLRGDPFIASKEDQSDALFFHTIHRRFEILGRPVIESYNAPPELLSIIAKRSPGLAEVVEEFGKMSSEQIKDEEFYEEDDEADAASDNEDGDDEKEDTDAKEEEKNMAEEYDQAIDHTFEEGAEVKVGFKVPTKVQTPNYNGKLEANTVCRPELSGEVWTTSRRGKVHIVHRKEFGEQKLLGFAQAGVLGLHGGKRLAVNYNCIRDGLAIIVLRVNVRPIEGENTKPEELRMSWLKVCSAAQISPNEVDLMGFNVRLGVFAQEDAAFFPVLNGITTEEFTWDGMSVFASPEETATSFYVSLTEAVEELRENSDDEELIRIRKVRVIAKNRRHGIVRPKLSGHGAYGGIVTSESLPITVHYNCNGVGTVKIGLDLLVDVVKEKDDGSLTQVDPRVHRISFYWKKICSVTPLSQLNAKALDPSLFSVDLGGKDSDSTDSKKASVKKKLVSVNGIIKNGVVDGLFSPKKSVSEAMSQLYSLNSDQNTIAFELFKSPRHVKDEDAPFHVGLRFHDPILSSSSSHVQVSLRDIGEMEELFYLGKEEYMIDKMNEDVDDGSYESAKRKNKHRRDEFLDVVEVNRDAPAFLVVDHVCTNTGDAVITLQLPVFGNTEKTVTLSWVKRCHWTETKLTAQQTGGAVVFFVILAILGTSSIFCVLLARQRNKLAFLQSKDKGGYDKMNVVSSI